MFEQFIYIAFFTTLAWTVLASIFNFVQAILMDVKKVKRIKNLSLPKTKLLKRPYVDIIVYSHNNVDAIKQSLQNVLNQSYRNYRIIVVDNNSTDQTIPLVRQFIADNPKKSVRLVAKTKHIDRHTAVLQAIKKYSSSDWILVMDAGCTLRNDSLHLANQYFIQNSHTSVLIPNIQIQHDETISGLLQQVRERLSLSAKKALRFDRTISAYSPVAIYQTDFVKKLNKDTSTAIDDTRVLQRLMKKKGMLSQLAFDEMFVVHSNALPYRTLVAQKLSNYKPRINTLQPLIIAYLLYVALRYDVYDYLLLAFFTFFTLLVLNIAYDRSLNLSTKLRAGFICVPLYSAYIVDNLITSIVSPLYFAKTIFRFSRYRT